MTTRGAIGLVLPLIALLLAACWTGPVFYARAEVRAPIPPGLYVSEASGFSGADDEETKGRVRVSIRPDGLTELTGADKREESSVFGFATLGGDDRFVAWTWIGDEAAKPDAEVLYLLLERDGVSYRLSFPGCNDEQRALAVASGAVFHDDRKAAMCRFPNRAAVERGLRGLAGPTLPTIRLEPVSG